MRMNGSIWRTAVCAVLAAVGATADDHLFSSVSSEGMTFHASFDAGTAAKKTVPAGKPAERFAPGLKGNALVAGRDEKGAYGLELPAEKTVSPERGSLMFWMKAEDWKVTDKSFNLLFSMRSPDNRYGLLVYRPGANTLQLLFNDLKDKKNDFVRYPLKSKFTASWHHVAAVWTPEELTLYVDGLPVGKKKRTFSWPADRRPKSFRIGFRGWQVEKGLTRIDDLKIFDRALDSSAVRGEFRKLSAAGPAGKSPMLTVGKKKPVTDGRIAPGEYASSGTGFCGRGGYLALQQSFFHLSHDGEYLYLGVKSPQKTPPRAEAAERDGKCWEDDSVELWLELPNRHWYQFIFNARGTVYDARFTDRTDPGWNCEGVKTAGKIHDGFWEFEAAIPLSQLENFKTARINIARTFRNVKEFTALGLGKTGGYGDRSHFIPLTLTDREDFYAVNALGDPARGKIAVDMLSALPAEICYATRAMTHLREKIAPVNGRIRCRGAYEQDGTGVLTIDIPGVYTGVFRPRPQTQVRLEYICTDTKKRILETVLRNDSGVKGTLLLKLAERGRPDGKVFTRKVPVTGQEIVWTVPWDVSKIPQGDYDYSMRFTDLQGEAGAEFVQWYRIPGEKNPWDDTPVGLYPGEVPAPWVPLKTGKRSVEALTQKYELGDSGLPRRLCALGHEILSRPAVFILNGKPLKFTDIALAKAAPDRVTFSGTAKSGDILAKVDVLAEYDGMLWFDFTFSGKGSINDLYAVFPLKNEFAREVHGFDRGAYRSRYPSGLVPKTGWRKNLYSRPAFWVGSETAGLSWYAEDLRGWRFSDPARTLELLPNDKETVMRLNMIDRPVKLEKPRRIAFGLHATPVRIVDREARASRFNQEWGWSDGSLYYNYLDSGKEFFDAKRLKHHQKRYQRKLKEEKLDHSRFFLYIGSNGASPYCPEWGWFGREWAGGKVGNYIVEYNIPDLAARNKWVWTYSCLNSKSFREFFLHQLANILRDPRWDVKNLYCDLCGPRMCDNREHGCGYTDDDGRSWGTLNVRGGRDFHKRLYHFLQKTHPGGKLMFHVSGQPAVMALHAFAAGGNLGETWFENDFQAKGFSYIGIFTPDMFRTQCCGAKWGYQIFYTPQFHRANKQLGTGRDKLYRVPDPLPEIKRAYRHFLGYLLVHDVNTFMGAGDRYLDDLNNLYWKARREFFGSNYGLGFIPYWAEKKPFSHDAALPVMVSAHVKGGRCMLSVMNDTDQARKMKIDLAGFGERFRLAPNPEGTAGRLEGHVLSDKVPARDFRVYFLIPEKDTKSNTTGKE